MKDMKLIHKIVTNPHQLNSEDKISNHRHRVLDTSKYGGDIMSMQLVQQKKKKKGTFWTVV